MKCRNYILLIIVLTVHPLVLVTACKTAYVPDITKAKLIGLVFPISIVDVSEYCILEPNQIAVTLPDLASEPLTTL